MTEPLTSVQKVEALIEYQSKQLGGDAIGQAAMAMARPMLNLPDDPDVLDANLVAYAQLCLSLRTDGTPPLQICDAAGSPIEVPA